MTKHPLIYAFIAFLATAAFIGFIMPALTCADGWASPSIGISGACSHHGGVDRNAFYITLSISMLVAFLVWKKAKKHKTTTTIPTLNGYVLHSLNSFLCHAWNTLIGFLRKIGFPLVFNKAPVITTIVCFICIVLFPAVMAILFVLGLVAFGNGATPQSHYFVPEKPDKNKDAAP